VSPRRATLAMVLSLVLVTLQVLLVQHAADRQLAHVLLGGHASASALLLSALLVVLRVLVVVVVPGVVLASVVSLGAHAIRQREGSSSGAGSSVAAGTGASMEGRGTK
jgi:hypothetical protein